MPAHRLIDHLRHVEAFGRIQDRLQSLTKLQSQLEAALPVELVSGTRIASLRQGKLIIHAESGAVAVKLRQLKPRLAAELRRQAPEISEIVVRVQPRTVNFLEVRPKNPLFLGKRAKRALTSLIQGLPETSSLREALLRLLRHGSS